MFATGRLKIAAVALAGSSLLVMLAVVVLTELAPAHLVVAALSAGTTIGQTLVAIPLVIITGRTHGKKSVQGVGRTTLAGLAATAAGASAGVAVSIALPIHHKLMAAGITVLAATCAFIVFGLVAYVLDDGELRTALARLRKRVMVRRSIRQQPT
jgi:putative peptidoglycan lipid II flippase